MMNYSESTKKHGRKIVSNPKRKIRNLINPVIITIEILIIIFLLIMGAKHSKEEQTTVEVEPYGQITDMVKTGSVPGGWEDGSIFYPLEDVNMTYDMQEFVFHLSKAYDLDFNFVMAVIKTESDYNPDLVSPTDDYGLMQINTINHDWMESQLGVTDMLDPYQNLNGGMYVLKYLFDKYNDPAKVLMAYNMGETGANKLWEKGITNSKYSDDVMEQAKAYSLQ